MISVSPRAASHAAYLAAALNLAAALAMLILLRPGLPVLDQSLAERSIYITGHRALWWLGWLLWQAAAVSLLGFYAGIAGRWSVSAPIRCRLALLCAATGMAADISAETLYMATASTLGARSLSAVDPVAGLLTGYVGNGLYTIAGILLVWAGAHQLPRRLLILSLPVWIAGVTLSASSLLGSAYGQLASTAVLMPLFVIWTALVGRWLSSLASS